MGQIGNEICQSTGSPDFHFDLKILPLNLSQGNSQLHQSSTKMEVDQLKRFTSNVELKFSRSRPRGKINEKPKESSQLQGYKTPSNWAT